MPLILPNATKAAARHPILMPVQQFYSHSEITGQTASVSDIVAELQPVPKSEALRWLCSLSKGILAEGGMSPATQLNWSRRLFPVELQRKIEGAMRHDGPDAGVLFHRRAVWLVLQLAVISCRDPAVDISKEEVAKRVGRACFMAGDVLNDIESESYHNLPSEDVTQWIIAALVPLHGSGSARPDLDLVGRAKLIWEEIASEAPFQTALADRNFKPFEDAFAAEHGISLKEFIRFLAAVYVRFLGKQLEPNLSPLLLDLANDDVGRAFDPHVLAKAVALISQQPNELAIRLLRNRQLWAFDVTPIRERPLLEVMPGKYCCPDLTLLVRLFTDRVYFLLENAYGKNGFRPLVGKLFECYIHRLVAEFAVTAGKGRTFLTSPRFSGTQDEAADGVFLWATTAAVMEFKAGLLTTRQRLAGIPAEIFQGIDSLATSTTDRGRKGVSQLARNISRMLGGESRIISHGDTFDVANCRTLYPILVCFDESLGFHAVRQLLQRRFDEELSKAGVTSSRVGPLMVLTVRDVETLTAAGQSISVETMLREYANYLLSQPNDLTGSFSSVLRHRFGDSIQWDRSLTCRKHNEVLRELVPRFESLRSGA